jgi:hypothetical protein
MTPEPDDIEDIDEILSHLDEKRQALETAIALIETEQSAGRTGHSAYSRAVMIRDDYRKLYDIAQAKIAEALATLSKS